MLALILSLAVASQQPTPVVSEAPPEAAPQSPAPLDSPREVRALCEALAPSGRIAPSKENAVDRGRAELAHDTRRQAALDGRYQVAIRSERLRFADYDADERELSLSERSFLATAGDSLQIWATHDVGLPVTVDVASAERIMQATARRALVLRLIFTLPDDEDGLSCGHASGSNRYSLGVEPFRWEYVEGNEVLARGGEGSDRPLITATKGARPSIRVTDPVGGGGEGLKSAVEAQQKGILNCYERALAHNPGLDGNLVAEFGPNSASSSGVRMVADSLQDEGMTRCVKDILSGLKISTGGREHASVSIHFELEPPSGRGPGK